MGSFPLKESWLRVSGDEMASEEKFRECDNAQRENGRELFKHCLSGTMLQDKCLLFCVEKSV